MHWLLQDNNFNESGWATLLDVIKRSGVSHSVHKVVPFVGEIIPDIDIDGPVICFGSYSLRHVAKRKGWTPGVFDLEPHDYEACIRHWGANMLNHDSDCFPLKQIDKYRDSDDAFYRPVGDNKNFAGGVHDYPYMRDLYDSVLNLQEDEVFYGLSPETMIIRSPIKNIFSEFRTWIVDGKLVTASQYKMGQKVIYNDLVDDDVLEYAQRMADIWQPERVFVLDVAKTDEGLRIVEINTMNAAGFYAADTYKLFEAIEAMEF